MMVSAGAMASILSASAPAWAQSIEEESSRGSAGVRVEVRADKPGVRIDRITADGSSTTVCFAPCLRVLARDGVYVIGGAGIRSTSQFALPRDHHQLVLDVEAAASARSVAGGLLVTTGGLALLFDVLSGPKPDAPVNASGSSIDDGIRTAMLVGGVLALSLGIYFVATSHTKVTTSSGVTFTRADAPRRSRTPIAFTSRGLEF